MSHLCVLLPVWRGSSFQLHWHVNVMEFSIEAIQINFWTCIFIGNNIIRKKDRWALYRELVLNLSLFFAIIGYIVYISRSLTHLKEATVTSLSSSESSSSSICKYSTPQAISFILVKLTLPMDWKLRKDIIEGRTVPDHYFLDRLSETFQNM